MEQGTCPVCNGTTRKPAGDNRYKHVIAGYDRETDTFACTNCGGQYMFGRPTGQVRLNYQGQPCDHVYITRATGRCLTTHTCADCGDRYDIDSGD